MSSSSGVQYWIKFFMSAGIPATEAGNYAITFSENRMQKSMLADLTKEYLNDMGITTMGDVIAVLKQAKLVHSEMVRSKALSGASFTPTAQPGSRMPTADTPAKRTLNHYIEPVEPKEAQAKQYPRNMAHRLGNGSSTNSPTPFKPSSANTKTITARKKTVLLNKKSVSAYSPVQRSPQDNGRLKKPISVSTVRRPVPAKEGGYKVIMPKALMQKTPPTPEPVSKSSVFKRLGAQPTLKRAATAQSPETEYAGSEASELEYVGVIKNSSSPKKIRLTSNLTAQNTGVRTVSTTSKQALVKTTSLSNRLGPAVDNSPRTRSEGILADSRSQNTTVQGRLGKPVIMAATSTTPNIRTRVGNSSQRSVTINKPIGVTKPAATNVVRREVGLNKPIRKRITISSDQDESVAEPAIKRTFTIRNDYAIPAKRISAERTKIKLNPHLNQQRTVFNRLGSAS